MDQLLGHLPYSEALAGSSLPPESDDADNEE
jgi:hypothetical protein